MFSPDFASQWIADRAVAAESCASPRRDEEVLSPAMEEALRALAERVNAARSVV